MKNLVIVEFPAKEDKFNELKNDFASLWFFKLIFSVKSRYYEIAYISMSSTFWQVIFECFAQSFEVNLFNVSITKNPFDIPKVFKIKWSFKKFSVTLQV